MYYFFNESKYYMHYNNELFCFDKKSFIELKNEMLFSIDEKNVIENQYFSDKQICYYRVYDLDSLYSINLQNDFENLDVKYILLNLFDICIILNSNNYTKATIIIERYIESLDSNINKFFKDKLPVIYFEDDFQKMFSIINNIKEDNLVLNDNEIIYIDKIKEIIVKETIVLKNSIRDFRVNIVKINKDMKYKTLETGYRINDKMIKFPVGRFSPILKAERVDSIDKCGIPIYEGITASNHEHIYFSVQGGKGYSQEQSYNSLIGESIERYSSRKFKSDKTLVANYNELCLNGVNVVNPTTMNIDKNNRFLIDFDENKNYEWVKAINLKDNKCYYVEASFVFFPYYGINNKDLFKSQTTTGLSCGATVEEAILQSLLEVIERDAYSLTHKAKLYSRVIDKEGLEDDILSLIDLLEDSDIYSHLLLLNNDVGIYVVHCTLEDINNQYPKYTHGCGAGLDINTAIRRSILEAIQLRVSQIELFNSDNYYNEKNIAYRMWGEGNIKYCEVFLETFNNHLQKVSVQECMDLRSNNFASDVNLLLNRISDNRVYVVDLSLENLDLKVIRLIIPSFQDIDYPNHRITERLLKLISINDINKDIIFS